MKTKERSQLLACCILMTLGVAHAQNASFTSPSIEPQPLSQALSTFAKQTGLQLIYVSDDADGRVSKPVPAGLAPADALERMLDGTGLAYEFINEKTVRIYARPVLQPTSTSTQDSDRKARSIDRPSSAAVSVVELEELVVTGSHIRGLQIIAAPSITMTRADIESTGAITVQELFESLPQNFDNVSPDGRFANEGGSRLGQLNNSRVTGLDLRGLGPQSTLTLINGVRLAGGIDGRVVDVSSIPLSMIERVEIVNGGRSAVYGSDAVAGVVNFVTRREFEGLETRLSYGAADSGGERLQVSQVGGMTFERGGFVAGYDYSRDWALELGEAGFLAPARAGASSTTLRSNAQADGRRHSLFASGRYQLTDRVSLTFDGMYTDKEFHDPSSSINIGALQESLDRTNNATQTHGLSVGAELALNNDWRLRMSAANSRVDNSRDARGFNDFGFFSYNYVYERADEAAFTTASAAIDGEIFALGSFRPRAAVGVEWRRDDVDVYGINSGVIVDDYSSERTVKSAFVELLVPLLEGNHAGAGQLQVSLAGRYDDYSDFGSTNNPQLGVVWKPLARLALRGAYSSAFRAPALAEKNEIKAAIIDLVADPSAGGALQPVLFRHGVDSKLGPEEASTWSFGLDYELASATQLSLDYYEIDYDRRVDQPITFAERPLVLERQSRFDALLNRGPTPELVSALLAGLNPTDIHNFTGIGFDPSTDDPLTLFPGLVTFDGRVSNIAEESVKGIDLKIDSRFATGSGEITTGFNATYTIGHERRVTASSPWFSMLNEVGKPVDLRLRAHVGWQLAGYSAHLYVNYMDDYVDPFSTPTSKMGSWTTVDMTLRWSAHASDTNTLLAGVNVALSGNNLFDRDPPRFDNSISGVLYDSTNGSPFGRYVSLRLVKDW